MNIWPSLDPNSIISLAICLPLLSALLILATGRWPNIREAVTLVTSALLFSLILSLIDPIMAGARPAQEWFELFSGLSIAFEIEPLGLVFALVASFLWIITSIYAIGYMRSNNESNQTRFFVCFAIAISSVMGICFSGNLLSLFIFYEILTLSTYPLVTHAGNDAAKQGGRVYLGILLSTSIAFFLLAILITWQLAGTLNFEPGGILADTASKTVLGSVLVLFCFGIGKAALMPFHRWLPAAMVAPTPVSALLHAVAVVKAGVFSILKVAIYIFGIDELATLPATDIVLYLAVGTMLLASLIALTKDNLKARLAYSTISQLSYIIVGAMLASTAGAIGGAMHIATHAFGKITLFFAAGAIYTAAHKTKVSQLEGIGKRMPLTMAAFTIGALSMIGLPPAAGFVSKWYLLLGAIDVGQWFVMGAIILSTLLNAAYLIPIVYMAFFKSENLDSEHYSDHGEAPRPMVFALLVTAAMTLILFFFSDLPLELAKQFVEILA